MNGKKGVRNGMWIVALAAALVIASPPDLPAAAPAQAQQQEAAAVHYERARQALNRAEYARAVELLRLYRQSSPDGRYLPESLYWEGFALSRMEGTSNLRAARDVLRTQIERYENAAVSQDARALLARVHGELARRGDSESARWVYENTAEAARDEGREREVRDRDRGVRDRERDVRTDETKVAALQALMNMDSERALPILRRVVQDHDNAPELRAQAMFILFQQDGEGVADLMLEAARSDPDPEVRNQAVFWLSKTSGDRALPILESILAEPADERLHDQALFAVSQLDTPRAREILRDYARSSSARPELRKNAIFWLGQAGSGESAAFMRELWDSTSEPEVREAILFSMSQMDGAGNAAWLIDIALDESENVEVRKQALFMAGQRDDVDANDLIAVYDRAPDRELKHQALFVLSQSDDPAAFDKMLDVARDDDDPELRRNAIFWIGQSGDSRAEDVLLEILQ